MPSVTGFPTTPSIPAPSQGFLAAVCDALPIWALTGEQKELRLSLCRILLGQDNVDCQAAARGILVLAFQENPFDAASLALLGETQAARPFLAPRATAATRLVSSALDAAPNDIPFDQILAGGDTELVVRYLEVAAKDKVHALGRLAPAFGSLCRLPDADVAAALLAGFAGSLPPPLYDRLAAELAVLRLSPETALERLSGLDPDAWGLYAAVAASHCLERLGRREEALEACLAAWRTLPQHVNLTLRAFALAASRAAAPSPQAGEAAVCLYSMNKAELFRDCLTHLAATDLGGAIVVALDNGSSDHTADVLGDVARLFPEGRFLSVRLPVNIGAPGARNWLLAQPEVAACRNVAFLDDDAFPPADWLARLLETGRRHPEAGAVGCAIVDRDAPHDHQSADFNLFPPDAGEQSLPETNERLFVCEPCRGAPDLGLYAYSRSCLSVSGCCHLLPRASLETVGGFDIRFNPTQFDDLDRDIRAFLAGRPAVYDGTVRVAHKQGSSLAMAQSMAQVAHIMGNKIKLEYKVSDADADKLWRGDLDMLRRDLLDKEAEVRRLAQG
ncbi:glycosyltransferase [Solidesulfovibrio sp.]|uniref:glycosyltransferase family 2 protein n=1 Tax=Solidesulfovibrio sp. TaxID=2910990 RepID=UPI0026314C2E|nr:glycosyltransferase [Solidesulfovibrio sp.]